MNDNTLNLVNQFREARNWRQFHNPKDLAISISLEASELLEVFQWKENNEVIGINDEQLKDEIADVLIYCIMLATDLNYDIDTIITEKLSVNADLILQENAS